MLSELSLELARGETLCILGPGGSGKSTLLSALEAIVTGEDPNSRPGPALWWRGGEQTTVRSCARLGQHGSFAHGRVGDLLGCLSDGERDWMPPGEAEREIMRAHLDIPLDEAPDPIRRYVNILLAANSPTPLLLLDEPLFTVSEPWAAAITLQLRRLAANRRTMVIVTHYIPLARELADRVMLMIDGRVIESAPREDFFCRAEHPRTHQYLKWGG